jgi:hypothetical protein
LREREDPGVHVCGDEAEKDDVTLENCESETKSRVVSQVANEEVGWWGVPRQEPKLHAFGVGSLQAFPSSGVSVLAAEDAELERSVSLLEQFLYGGAGADG